MTALLEAPTVTELVEVATVTPRAENYLSEPEARECITRIKELVMGASNQLQDARRELLHFHQKFGWLSLGYESFSECCEKEFTFQRRHIYRLIDAAKMDDRLARKLCPIGHKYQALPEGLLRELGELDDDELDQVLEVATSGLEPGEAPSSEDMHKAQRMLEEDNPEIMASEARREGREARKRADARARMTAREKSAKKLRQASKLMYTALRWLDNEGWSVEQMHELLDKNFTALMEEKAKRGKKGREEE